MLTAYNVAEALKNGIIGLLLTIDGIVYWFVGFLFELFTEIAGAEIIKSTIYEEIRDRFLVIIGVFMLFYLAYSLLKSLVNPDDAIKNTSKIITNLIISLVLLSIVPTIFSYAFKIQNIIISDHVIDNVVFGNTNNSISSVGKTTAMNFFDAFVDVGSNAEIEGYSNWQSLRTCIIDNKISGCNGDENFRHVSLLSDSAVAGDTQYIFIISTLCGCFLAYVIFSFCLDMGVRVVKLAFYQIISPIPIMMRIIPEKKSVFDNWVKATMATYFEVFIRLFIMYIIAFLCSKIFSEGVLDLGNNVGILGTVIIVMGLFAFAKQAPKLIGDVIGVNAGNLKLGIKDKLAAGGAFTAGALIGGGVTAGMRNLTNGIGNVKNAQGFKNKFKAGLGTITSTGAGMVSGAARGGKAGWNAKSATDMAKSAGGGAAAAVNKRDERAAYKASHGGTMRGAALGHIVDSGSSIKNWATGGTAGILGKTKFEEEFKSSYKEYEAIYENPNYNAMKSQLQQYEALKASGVTSYEGKDVGDAIKELKGNMLKSRLDSIRGNTQSAAYAMYNIAQLANKNPSLVKDIGIDVSMVKDLELKGNKIVDRTTNVEVSAERLYEMIEGTSLTNVSYDSTTKTYKDSGGTPVDFDSIAQTQNKDGMSHQKKKASDQLRIDQLSVEYKEAKKREESKK